MTAGTANALFPIAQFRETIADANGVYLWSEPNNWVWANTDTLSGLPKIEGQVEIGDDYSGPVHSTLDLAYAESYGVEIAEGFYMGRTAGSSLHVLQGTTLASYAAFQVGKDDKGFLTVDGTVSIRTDLYSASHFYIGSYGHYNARGTATISSTGTVNAGASVIVMGIKMPGWGDSTGANEFDYGSSLTVDGGTLTFKKGMQLYSPLPWCPGTLRITDAAVVTQESHSANFFDVEQGGVLEINGGGATINVKVLSFGGGWSYYGSPSSAVLKFTGNGISTVNVAGAVTLGWRTVLDVGGLNVAPGTYKLIDGNSISNAGLAFAAGTDTNDWSFEFDFVSGDLLLSYALPPLGDMDGSGKVDSDDINPFVLALVEPNAYMAAYGMDPSLAGDCDDDGVLTSDDIDPFVALFTSGQAVPAPATLSLLAVGWLVPMLSRSKRRRRS